MSRSQAYFTFVLLAPLAAGLFGILHNQISYSIAPEYFTHFKFIQFGLMESELPPRLLASAVGLQASWWMGIPLGLIGGLGLLATHPGPRRRRALWGSLATMLGVTLLIAVAGLAYGWYVTRHIDLAQYQGWFIPDGVALRPFLSAGHMHNAAYLGGVLSLAVAWFVQLWQGRFARPEAP
jgi:hypothetical protein